MPPTLSYREEQAGDRLRPGWDEMLVRAANMHGPEGQTVFVAADQLTGDLTAMCSYTRAGNEAECRDFVILPTLAVNVGQDILGVALDHAKAAGVTRMWLHCRDDPQYPARSMRAYFRARGYEYVTRYDAGWIEMDADLSLLAEGP